MYQYWGQTHRNVTVVNILEVMNIFLFLDSHDLIVLAAILYLGDILIYVVISKILLFVNNFNVFT